MARDIGGDFIWEALDQTPVWTNWKNGHPDIDNDDETCVVLQQDGQWRERRCDDPYYPLCEQDEEQGEGKEY